MGENNERKVKPRQTKTHTSKKYDYDDSLELLLKGDYDWSMTNIAKLPPIEQYLTILQIAKIEFDIPMLAIEDVRNVLQEKFRINKTTNNIGMTLMKKVGNYVDRIKDGGGYYYRITGNGETFLEDAKVIN